MKTTTSYRLAGSPEPIPAPPRTEACPPPVCEIAPEPNTAVNLGAFLGESRDDGFPSPVPPPPPETSTAKSERPPAFSPDVPGMPPRLRTAAMVAMGLALLVVPSVVVLAARIPPPSHVASPLHPASMPTEAHPRGAPPCTAGDTRILACGVRLASGVEVLGGTERIAAAVTTSPVDVRAVELDPASLAVRSTARLTTARPVRRALPLLPDGEALDVAADDGAAFPDDAVTERLRGPGVDAVRAARIDAATVAVVLRRAGAIQCETSHRGTVVDGPVTLSQEGDLVGAPSVATTRGGDVVSAWAERASRADAWRVRWTRWTPGAEPEPPRTLDTAGVSAIAPSVAALPGGPVLLAWTEGSGGAHGVRALVLGADGEARGGPMAISATGVNAGQEQLALVPGAAPGGARSVVFFLAAQPDGRFALVARGLSCDSP